MSLNPEDIFRLVLSLFVGGIIGAEREWRDKTAGFRTLMFISAGSTLFTIFSMRMAASIGVTGDPARIAAQIVTGIGFLGAGAIIRTEGELYGLTTAATIWLAAALGMGVGAGEYLFSVAGAVIILLALLVFPSVEHQMGRLQQVITYRFICSYDPTKIKAVTDLFNQSGLHVLVTKTNRQGRDMVCTFRVRGKAAAHQNIIEKFLEDLDLKEFEY